MNVSSPLHVERSVRISRTALPHSLHAEESAIVQDRAIDVERNHRIVGLLSSSDPPATRQCGDREDYK